MSGIDTNAGTLLWLAPDWADPETWLGPLSAYVVFAPADGDTCLCLDAGDSDLPIEVVVELLTLACEVLGDGRPFAETLLVDGDDGQPGRAVPIATIEDAVRALDLTVAHRAQGASRIVAHARAAKSLLDALRDRVDRWRFETAPDPAAEPEPLVTVRIPTYGEVGDLMSRALPSVLSGAYRNVEVLVVSDGPQPHAREAIESVRDPRVRYLELPERPSYASHFHSFWQTAGIFAINHALDEARGSYIAPLDHDDAFTVDHISTLLGAARVGGADFVYGQAMCEQRSGPWYRLGSEPLRVGALAHGTVLYSRRLGHIRFDPDCWLIDDPGDWNLWRRFAGAGARVLHLPVPVLVHFRERTMIEDDPRVDERQLLGEVSISDDDLAADVLGTGARRLLGIATHEHGIALAHALAPSAC